MAISALNTTTLASNLDLPAGTVFTITGSLDMFALSNTSLASFSTFEADRFLIMSTGIAAEVGGSNSSGSQGTDLGEGGVTDDAASLSFELDVPENADFFGFTFTFLSEEYPEYVGSAFNDYFSVKINGIEVALDTNNNPISVNNDFFSDTLTPVLTFFDGQTPVLGISADVSGLDTIQVELSIADVGDGIYDSAAFIGNFGFSEEQVVYLNFDGGAIDYTIPGISQNGVTMAASGIAETVQATVKAQLEAIYAPFNVTFTTDKPTSGEYTTILIGGEFGDLPQWVQDNKNPLILGTVSRIDTGNTDRADDSFVLAGEINNDATWSDAQIALLSQVVAHEAGHLFGLHHVDEIAALMYPVAGATRTAINNDEELYHQLFGSQDSYDELGRNLGLEGNQVLVDSTSFLDEFLALFGFSLDSTAGGSDVVIHDAIAVIYALTDDEGVTPIETIELGEISEDFSASFATPALDGYKVAILGASVPGGPLDVVLSDGEAKTLEAGNTSIDYLLSTFGVDTGDIGSASLSFGQVQEDGSLDTLVAVTGVKSDAADSSATNGNDLITGAEGNDTLFGLAGNDIILGLGGDDSLLGGDDNDRIEGGDGNDIVNGDDGDDQLLGQAGNDTLNGGAGNDTISSADGDDVNTGGAGNDRIGGGEGNDVMDGGLGNDFMGGGPGADTCTGGDGRDVVNGGQGNDSLEGGAGSDTMGGSFNDDTVNGGDGNDSLGGGAGNDLLDGGAGNDSMGGGFANDTLRGGDGDDFIGANTGNDVLNGGNGNDTLNGGDGNDILIGGAGEDVFVFLDFNAGETDLILGFEDGADTIFLVGIDAVGLQGRVDALNITDTTVNGVDRVTLTYEGHTIQVTGVTAADLTLEDFQFL